MEPTPKRSPVAAATARARSSNSILRRVASSGLSCSDMARTSSVHATRSLGYAANDAEAGKDGRQYGRPEHRHDEACDEPQKRERRQSDQSKERDVLDRVAARRQRGVGGVRRRRAGDSVVMSAHRSILHVRRRWSVAMGPKPIRCPTEELLSCSRRGNERRTRTATKVVRVESHGLEYLGG